MKTTAIDVSNKKFSRSFRGYRPSEVDDLMRDVASELETAAREWARLEDQIDKMHGEVARYKEMEDTLNNAILLAQRSADEVRAAAHRDADTIVREAEQHAREITERAVRENQELMHETRRLSERRAAFVDSLRSAARDLGDWIQGRRWQEVIEIESVRPEGQRPEAADDSDEQPAAHEAAG